MILEVFSKARKAIVCSDFLVYVTFCVFRHPTSNLWFYCGIVNRLSIDLIDILYVLRVDTADVLDKDRH